MTSKFISEKKVGSLIAILFGCLSLYEGIQLYPLNKNLLTGDHAFPGLIGLLLIIFGLAVFFDRKIEGNQTNLPSGRTRLNLLLTILILFIYCLFIMLVGYVISTLIVSIALIKMIGNYRWLFSVLMGAAITTVLYYLFIVLLKIPFPSGYFGF
ncbi:tripartite tricarboxylate transporter TctB family protein [Niallia oryzisoli]|uniref:Tripartite tricarboxylate transporter TctB family protein n=1 Tax=Niallia oryzisoli TaxID=1737571 RepID=A0ABZ2CDD1_9BACI